jgi:diguanylate cyclase (GGDEF)-like protein/PAS domain S-box-containing protein
MGGEVNLDGILPGVPQNAQSLRILLSAMPIGVSWANLADQKILFMNRNFTETFGYILSDFATIPEWNERAYPFREDRTAIANTWGVFLADPDHTKVAIEPLEVRVRCKDDTVKTAILSGVILRETGWALATFVDISDRKRDELLIQAAVRQANENQLIYRMLLDNSPEMIVLSSLEESRRYVTAAVERITGFTAEEYLARKLLDMIHPEDRELFEYRMQELKEGKLQQTFRYRTLQKGGGYCWVEATVIGYLDPASKHVSGYVATVRDISEEKEREERLNLKYRQLSKAASLDELTGIANRRAFNQAIENEARRHTRSSRDLSLLLIDVDHFKAYNDLYGHLPGDLCLKRIASAIKQALRRAPDLAARFGGEEFVVLMPSTGISGAEAVAGKMLDAVAALGIRHAHSPFGIVTVSIGAASWPSGLPLNADALIERADRALYRAKDRGRNTCVTDDPQPFQKAEK